ncbi:MAG: hypothetical protein ACK4TL_18505 [Hyphomicrobiaceae bacterium]
MPLHLVAPPDPAHPVLSLDAVKAHLRVDHSDDDAVLALYRDAVIQSLDGRDGWLGRALHAQTWELRLDSFCSREIEVPLPPLIAVLSVEVLDDNDAVQALDPSMYEVIGIGGHNPARLVLADGPSWPSLSRRRAAIRIRFRAGYRDPDATPAGEVPAPIKAGALMTIGTLYENREDVLVGGVANLLPGQAAQLLAPYEVHYIP